MKLIWRMEIGNYKTSIHCVWDADTTRCTSTNNEITLCASLSTMYNNATLLFISLLCLLLCAVCVAGTSLHKRACWCLYVIHYFVYECGVLHLMLCVCVGVRVLLCDMEMVSAVDWACVRECYAVCCAERLGWVCCAACAVLAWCWTCCAERLCCVRVLCCYMLCVVLCWVCFAVCLC